MKQVRYTCCCLWGCKCRMNNNVCSYCATNKKENKMNLTDLVNQNRDLLTTISTNHSFGERLNAMANLPMELARYLLDEVKITNDAGEKVPAGPIDRAATQLLAEYPASDIPA